MNDDLPTLIDELISAVESSDFSVDDKRDEIRRLDVAVGAECIRRGITIPAVAIEEQGFTPFGQTHIPHYSGPYGDRPFVFHFCTTSNWRQAMRSVAAAASMGRLPPGGDRELPIVESDAQSASITWKRTRHPVPHDTADAFRALIAGSGQPRGLGRIVRKPSEWHANLPPELKAIVKRADGNKGYRLTVFD